MNFGKFALGGALLASALIAQPAAATTFLAGAVRSNATYTYGGSGASDPKSATLAAPGSIAVSSASGLNVGGASPTISVHSSLDATWASANAGSIDTTWGWAVDTIYTSLAFSTYTTTGQPGWSYSFVASGDGVFTMDYSLAATGFLAGLNGFVGSGGLGNAILSSGASSASGTLIVPLVAGQAYNFGLSNYGGISNSGGSWVRPTSATGEFNWAITYDAVASIPEPASWAMMIGGLALVGGVLRRRGGFAATLA